MLRRCEIRTRHRAMLAGEIADLTGLRLVRIARSRLARHVRIEVAVGGGAVAVGAHGEGVDVVD